MHAMDQAPGHPSSGGPGDIRRPASETELGFVRRPMVRWLDPHQLLDTAVRVVASGFWSSYTDNRELQALVPSRVHDRSEPAELWVDYTSDLGDGFNPTYTVASLLAQDTLDPAGHPTQRGQMLVMGGDQVYPVPKRTEYENRLLGPYRAAMPSKEGDRIDLFAIPGSHDWYDGLINFTNIFCRGRDLGALRTSQARSYFAVALPHRWWLWGIDLQFGDFLDEAQLRYFADIASDAMRPGDRIVLCMAKEVDSGPSSAEVCSDRDVGYLEREVVTPAGGRIEVFLKSGRHYYARYEEEGGRQLITAGGGGAFLHPTHNLPESTSPHGPAGEQTYRRAALYPSEQVSKRLRKRVFLLPGYNLPLAALLGTVHVMLAFLLRLHLEDRYLSIGGDDLWLAVWESPAGFLLILLLVVSIGAMVLLAHDASGFPRLLLGVAHSLLQVGGLVFVFVVASEVAAATGTDTVASLIVFLAVVWVIGGVGGVLGIAGYFWFTNCLGYHGNEVYAPLHHEDLKNFLRLHFGPDGGLTIYPIGIDHVGRHWKLRPDGLPHTPWFVPRGDLPEIHLIEPPIRIEGRG